TPSDADVVWHYRRQDEVSRYMTKLPGTLEEYRESFAEADRLGVTLIVERDGQVVGDFMIRISAAWAQAEVAERAEGTQAEIGWAFDPAHHRNGYATEAAR